MAARQGITRTMNNPNAKYRIHRITYIAPDGTAQTKVFITRKNNEPINEKNQSVF